MATSHTQATTHIPNNVVSDDRHHILRAAETYRTQSMPRCLGLLTVICKQLLSACEWVHGAGDGETADQLQQLRQSVQRLEADLAKERKRCAAASHNASRLHATLMWEYDTRKESDFQTVYYRDLHAAAKQRCSQVWLMCETVGTNSMQCHLPCVVRNKMMQ